jgi:O-antigen ligase
VATLARAQSLLNSAKQVRKVRGASFFWLSAFYLVYCIRPEDWVPGLAIVPLAKITAIAAVLAFVVGAGRTERHLSDLPRESYYLVSLIGVLVLSSLFSPIWRSGALFNTLNFAKIYVVWVLTFLLVTDLTSLRRIIFIQAGAVPVVCVLSLIKGHSRPRLEGILGGVYSNSNDLAFAIVLSLPFCLMFFLTARGVFRKLIWIGAMLAMAAALVLTASRGGFVTLLVAGAVCLWHFGIKEKRPYLIAATGLVFLILLGVAGGQLKERFSGMWSDKLQSQEAVTAYGSYEDRKRLNLKALEGIEQHPFLGLGPMNFETYSTEWREVHNSYLQIAVEGGIPSLILYLMFFGRGFRNLRLLLKRKGLSADLRVITRALHASMVGFMFGALFAPEAYMFFPFFAVGYTSVLVNLAQETGPAASGGLVSAQRVRVQTPWSSPTVPSITATSISNRLKNL